MRARQISPGFFSSDQVVAVSFPARLLFIGLWTLADRDGRLRDEPSRIKRQIFPDDRVDTEKLLAELAGEGLVDRYVVDGVPLMCIPAFPKHQSIHPHEARSKLAPPPRDREMSLHDTASRDIDANVHRLIKPSVNQDPHTPKPPRGAVGQVFDTWVASTGHTGCKLDEPRRRKITARLAEYPLEDVLDAVRGWERDPWEDRRKHNEITILLRDNAHLEKFRDLWRQAAPPKIEPQSTGEIDRLVEMQRQLDANPDPEVPNVLAAIAARMHHFDPNASSLDSPRDGVYASGHYPGGDEEREGVTEANHPQGSRRTWPLAADDRAVAS